MASPTNTSPPNRMTLLRKAATTRRARQWASGTSIQKDDTSSTSSLSPDNTVNSTTSSHKERVKNQLAKAMLKQQSPEVRPNSPTSGSNLSREALRIKETLTQRRRRAMNSQRKPSTTTSPSPVTSPIRPQKLKPSPIKTAEEPTTDKPKQQNREETAMRILNGTRRPLSPTTLDKLNDSVTETRKGQNVKSPEKPPAGPCSPFRSRSPETVSWSSLNSDNRPLSPATKPPIAPLPKPKYTRSPFPTLSQNFTDDVGSRKVLSSRAEIETPKTATVASLRASFSRGMEKKDEEEKKWDGKNALQDHNSQQERASRAANPQEHAAASNEKPEQIDSPDSYSSFPSWMTEQKFPAGVHDGKPTHELAPSDEGSFHSTPQFPSWMTEKRFPSKVKNGKPLNDQSHNGEETPPPRSSNFPSWMTDQKFPVGVHNGKPSWKTRAGRNEELLDESSVSTCEILQESTNKYSPNQFDKEEYVQVGVTSPEEKAKELWSKRKEGSPRSVDSPHDGNTPQTRARPQFERMWSSKAERGSPTPSDSTGSSEMSQESANKYSPNQEERSLDEVGVLTPEKEEKESWSEDSPLDGNAPGARPKFEKMWSAKAERGSPTPSLEEEEDETMQSPERPPWSAKAGSPDDIESNRSPFADDAITPRAGTFGNFTNDVSDKLPPRPTKSPAPLQRTDPKVERALSLALAEMTVNGDRGDEETGSGTSGDKKSLTQMAMDSVFAIDYHKLIAMELHPDPTFSFDDDDTTISTSLSKEMPCTPVELPQQLQKIINASPIMETSEEAGTPELTVKSGGLHIDTKYPAPSPITGSRSPDGMAAPTPITASRSPEVARTPISGSRSPTPPAPTPISGSRSPPAPSPISGSRSPVDPSPISRSCSPEDPISGSRSPEAAQSPISGSRSPDARVPDPSPISRSRSPVKSAPVPRLAPSQRDKEHHREHGRPRTGGSVSPEKRQGDAPGSPEKQLSSDAMDKIRGMEANNISTDGQLGSDAGSSILFGELSDTGSSVIFGDPTTFGSAAGDTVGVPPPVSERAKAIEEWKGGRGMAAPPGSFPTAEPYPDPYNLGSPPDDSPSKVRAMWSPSNDDRKQPSVADRAKAFEQWPHRNLTPEKSILRESSPKSAKKSDVRVRFSDPPGPRNLNEYNAFRAADTSENDLSDAIVADRSPDVDKTENSSVTEFDDRLKEWQDGPSDFYSDMNENAGAQALEYWASSEDSNNFNDTEEWANKDPEFDADISDHGVVEDDWMDRDPDLNANMPVSDNEDLDDRYSGFDGAQEFSVDSGTSGQRGVSGSKAADANRSQDPFNDKEETDAYQAVKFATPKTTNQAFKQAFDPFSSEDGFEATFDFDGDNSFFSNEENSFFGETDDAFRIDPGSDMFSSSKSKDTDEVEHPDSRFHERYGATQDSEEVDPFEEPVARFEPAGSVFGEKPGEVLEI